MELTCKSHREEWDTRAAGSECNISETATGHLKEGVGKNTLKDLQDIIV